MNLQNVVQYVKKHKEVILIVAGTTILGIVGYNVYSNQKSLKLGNNFTEITNDYASMGVGKLHSAFKIEDGLTFVTLDNTGIEDFGKVGEELLKVNPNIKTVGVIVGFKE